MRQSRKHNSRLEQRETFIPGMEKLKITGRLKRQAPIQVSVMRWHDGARGQSLSPEVKLFATGWQAALHRSGNVQLETSDWQAVSPRVVSIPLDAVRPRSQGFRFS